MISFVYNTLIDGIHSSQLFLLSRSYNSWYIFSKRASLSLTSFLPWFCGCLAFLFSVFWVRLYAGPAGSFFSAPTSAFSSDKFRCLGPAGEEPAAASLSLAPNVRMPRDLDLDCFCGCCRPEVLLLIVVLVPSSFCMACWAPGSPLDA